MKLPGFASENLIERSTASYRAKLSGSWTPLNFAVGEAVSTTRAAAVNSTPHLDMVGLSTLMTRTSGRPEISIGLIDGPVVLGHPDLAAENIREAPGKLPAGCSDASNPACMHGTFIAGILFATRNSVAPAICPGCSLLIRPIFSEMPVNGEEMPGASAEELAGAIIDVIYAGVRIINLSVALHGSSASGERSLQQALDFAVSRGAVVVAAGGNQGIIGGSPITCHPWVIPVVAYDLRGHPMSFSNLGASIGRRGVGAPGESVTSLGVSATPLTMGGTSAATPFVVGAIALIWSEFPDATAAEVRSAVTLTAGPRNTIVPPLLDTWASYTPTL